MVYSSEFLSGVWFEIYCQVLRQNEKLKEDRMKNEQLCAVATTIFIQAGQRGYLKPAPLDSFSREMLKLTGKTKDRELQKSIYESVKHMINGIKEVA